MDTPPHTDSSLRTGYPPLGPITSTPVSSHLVLPSSGSNTTTRTSSVSSSSVSLPTTEAPGDMTPVNGPLLPGQLEVPILGYEVVEERAKYTVFKIQIFQGDSQSWFIFRRYTDFCRLNSKLSEQFPHFRLALPPKKWFGDNFDPLFLEDRVLGLQAFLNNVISNRDVCNNAAVHEFLCIGLPPGPHDTLEESRALCDFLEGEVYSLKQELQAKDTKLALLEDECTIYRQEVANLRNALRFECDHYEGETCRVRQAVHHAINVVLLRLLERKLNRLSPAPSSEPSETSLTGNVLADSEDQNTDPRTPEAEDSEGNCAETGVEVGENLDKKSAHPETRVPSSDSVSGGGRNCLKHPVQMLKA